MSVEAISWALNDAPGVPPQLVAVLVGLANHAGPDGRNAFASQARLARYARKSDRAVRNDLKELLRLGLIRVSENQGAAAHIRADLRPVVYDLALEKTSGSQVPGAPGTGVPAGSTVPAVNGAESGQGRSTTGSTVPGGSKVPTGSTASNDRKRTSDKPTTNQKKTSSSSPSRKRSGRADDEQTETEPDPVVAARVDTAKRIVEWWWDQLDPKPAGGSRAFFASRTEVEKLLAVGWEPKAIANAARTIGSPITVARMEIELNRMRRNNPNGAPNGHAGAVPPSRNMQILAAAAARLDAQDAPTYHVIQGEAW